MLCDFMVKMYKIWKGNLHLTENRLRRNKMSCEVENHNYMRHISAKGFSGSNFKEVVIDKI